MLHRISFVLAISGLATFAGLRTSSAAEVFIDSLQCNFPEDMAILGDGDECRLQILVDGVPVRTLRFDLTTSQLKRLALRFEAQRDVTLILHDEDWPDSDDHLGTVVIPVTPQPQGRTSIAGRHWQYFLNYRVLATRNFAPATYFATLDSLTCNVTEDSKVDQCRLDIYVDGVFVESLRQDMRKGQVWDLGGRRYAYRTQVTVRLWDLDHDTFGGGHDRLGDVAIGQQVGPNRGGQFLRDGASYHLRYRTAAVR